jgi:SAM-dependent methyltransferase
MSTLRDRTKTLPPLPMEICQCPICGSNLDFKPPRIHCRNATCASQPDGFRIIAGRPALIDFAHSVIDSDALMDRGSVSRHRLPGIDRRFHMRIYDAIFGVDESASHAAREFQQRLRGLPHRPWVLVIGGGTIGAGVQPLYDDPAIDIIGFDVYDSPNIQLLADAHAIPFADSSFDAVWIQAVLEHVLEPEKVVAEIHRVLRADGLVYAGTPFMQQVHEGPYDFSRFTLSGHRWLFRRFTEIDSGVQGGTGMSMCWSIRYFFGGLFRSYWAGRLAGAAFIWLRYLDALIPASWAVDGACGVWFLGSRSEVTITPRQVLTYYRGAQGKVK